MHRVLLSLITVLALAASAAAADTKSYMDFGDQVTKTVKEMRTVGTEREQSDARALEFVLREYNQALAVGNWAKADIARRKMGVYLVRGNAVAMDAGRRKAELQQRNFQQAEAAKERRHRETMRQQERQRKERQQQHQETLWWMQYLTGRR